MIKSVEELKRSTPTNLERIGMAIEEANNRGNKYLNLFEREIYTGAGRFIEHYNYTFNYTHEDLKELKKLGYQVVVSHCKTHYSGWLWWKKVTGTSKFHTIHWK